IKIADDIAYSKAMKILMEIAKYVMEAVSLVVAPGIGGGLVAALMIILDAAGVFDLLTKAVEQALEKDGVSPETGKWVADVIVGAMEMIVTMGGGAALDAALKSVMENVLKEIGSALEKGLAKEATEAATKAVSEAIDETASKMVAPTLKIAAQKAAEQA